MPHGIFDFLEGWFSLTRRSAAGHRCAHESPLPGPFAQQILWYVNVAHSAPIRPLPISSKKRMVAGGHGSTKYEPTVWRGLLVGMFPMSVGAMVGLKVLKVQGNQFVGSCTLISLDHPPTDFLPAHWDRAHSATRE